MGRKVLLGVAIAFAVLGGTAWAGSRWIITGTNQIKPNVLRQLHGARGATGPRGLAGATGTSGAAGPAGAPGSFSTANVVTVTGPLVAMCPSSAGTCAVAGSFASCPPGAVAVGGGWFGGSSPPVVATVADDDPIGNNTAWDVVMVNNGPLTSTFQAYAECATGSGSLARGVGHGAQAQASSNLQAARAAH
jgi:hypothetical protein